MKERIQTLLAEALQQLALQRGIDPAALCQGVGVERSRDAQHGDFASNVAMQYARIFGLKPRELAEALLDIMPEHEFAKIEIAGPGFLNVHLAQQLRAEGILRNILEQGERYGYSDLGHGERVLLEFVSANPTGPLHVGHGRGAAYGDTLANILRAVGYQVDKEYYVNDAGRQMNILAISVYLRYLQLCGAEFQFPTGIYQGDYVKDIAATLRAQYGERLRRDAALLFADAPDVATQTDAFIDHMIEASRRILGEDNYQQVFNCGLEAMVEDIRQDLAEFGVTFDRWFSEKNLHTSGQLQRAIDVLKDNGQLYEHNGAWWFRSSQYGDEKDRVVIRENGVATYFAADIAYHYEKYQRGYDCMIDIFGADHHGYMARVKASMQALNCDPAKLHIQLVQFAVLYRGGEKVQMSTRSGQFVTLRDLREQVGNDAARFFYTMRKVDQHLDFDLDLAISQSKDNPLYYVQYAHARACRILEHAASAGVALPQDIQAEQATLLDSAAETALLKTLARYPEVLQQAARDYAPHVVVNYLRDLAADWHHYYDAGYKIIQDDKELQTARLLLVVCVRRVLANALQLIGVQPAEKM